MVLVEGKTKQIIEAGEDQVLLMTKDDLTGGDAAKKETIAGISVHKTTQTSNVFKLLNHSGVPTAFIRQEDQRTLRCDSCEMLPLELVMRRFAWGSFLKREPDLVSTVENPHRFANIHAEVFHKHAVVMPPLVGTPVQMEEGKARDQYLKNGVWADGVYTDPFVRVVGEDWFLHSAKLPVTIENTLMQTKALLNSKELKILIEDIMIPVFKVLESAWAKVETDAGPVSLVDIKIECGRRKKDGQLVVADVIDNDSWRIWPGADPRRQLDKQCFRDGHALSDVASNYELVAELTGQFLQG